jgi:hypothetical protein
MPLLKIIFFIIILGMLIKHDLGNQQFYNKIVKKIKVKINFILRLLMWRAFGRFL